MDNPFKKKKTPAKPTAPVSLKSLMASLEDFKEVQTEEIRNLSSKFETATKNAIQLENLRRILGSVDVFDVIKRYDSQVEQGKTSPEDYKAYLAKVHELQGNTNLARLIEDIMVLQTRFVAQEATDWGAVCYGRGALNGVKLVWDTIDSLANEYRELIKNDEDDEAHEVY